MGHSCRAPKGERYGGQGFQGCSAEPGDIAGIGALSMKWAAVEPDFDQLGVGMGLRQGGRGREEVRNSDFGHFPSFSRSFFLEAR